MADWINWLVAAGVLVVLELFTGTFYLLMIAIGLGSGALAALAGMSVPVQTIVAAVVGVAATGLLHRSRLGRPARANPARDPNVNIDIGQVVRVDEWRDGKARVRYRGALWDVELGHGALPEAGDFKIVEMHGSRLVVTNA
jgi:membrane protein implicated in regulation of membrane protease activity